MYAKVKRTIEPASAMSIAEKAILNFMKVFQDKPKCNCGNDSCSCVARYWESRYTYDLVSVSPDWTGAEMVMV